MYSMSWAPIPRRSCRPTGDSTHVKRSPNANRLDALSCDFTTLTAGGVRTLQPYEPGKPVEELERELGISDSLKLASNENPLGPSPLAVAAIRNAAEGIERYPDGNGFALKQALAELHSFKVENITLGNGSNEILELMARTFVTPVDEVVFSEHGFAVYPLVTRAVGATARVAKANPADHDMPHGDDLAAFESHINDATRLIFIANPNNPTGTWLRHDTLYAFIKSVPGNVLVVVDQAYSEYVQEEDYPDASNWISEFPNLVVTQTFSKIYGIAGVRIGYSISSPEVADLLNRVRQPFNTNHLAQAAALAALSDKAHVIRSREINSLGLQYWVEECAARHLNHIPSVANFISVDVGRPALPVYDALLHEAVIVRPIANYGLPHHLRITIATDEQNQRVLQALDKVLGL